MFKIMKGYKNFDFTPSGKSLKKTLMGSTAYSVSKYARLRKLHDDDIM